jgi:hypothetical protein
VSPETRACTGRKTGERKEGNWERDRSGEIIGSSEAYRPASYARFADLPPLNLDPSFAQSVYLRAPALFAIPMLHRVK